MPSKSVAIKCTQCGQVGSIRQGDIAKLKRPWLCAACRSLSENNPAWRGGISGDFYRYKLNSIRRYPERNKIRMQTRYHVRAGHVKPQPCEVCGDKAECHHYDYQHWSHVVWLCRKHHKDEHKHAEARR